jgi:RNA polymerase sigma-70 factor (ECF subfamily)
MASPVIPFEAYGPKARAVRRIPPGRRAAPPAASTHPTPDHVTAHEAADAVARRSWPALLARLAARTRDVAGAEDALASAFLAALVDWPAGGVPRSPEAWLLAVARRKWIDTARRRRSADQAAGHLRLVAEESEAAAAAAGEPGEDRALALACGHPALEPALRAPILLQAVLGFDAEALASAFRISPVAMSQRLVRAKKRLREAGPVFEVPARAELEARATAVCQEIWRALGGAQPSRCARITRSATRRAVSITAGSPVTSRAT